MDDTEQLPHAPPPGSDPLTDRVALGIVVFAVITVIGWSGVVWDLWAAIPPDSQLKLLESSAIVVAAVIAAGAAVFQLNRTKDKEILFRLHEQRRRTYQDLLDALVPVLSQSTGNQSETTSQKTGKLDIAPGVTPADWMKAQIGLGLYGTEETVASYLSFLRRLTEFQHIPEARRSNPQALVEMTQLGNVLLQMRRDVGLGGTTLRARDMLALFINDIQLSAFDYLFGPDAAELASQVATLPLTTPRIAPAVTAIAEAAKAADKRQWPAALSYLQSAPWELPNVVEEVGKWVAPTALQSNKEQLQEHLQGVIDSSVALRSAAQAKDPEVFYLAANDYLTHITKAQHVLSALAR